VLVARTNAQNALEWKFGSDGAHRSRGVDEAVGGEQRAVSSEWMRSGCELFSRSGDGVLCATSSDPV